jgi:hypothetical protein
MMSSDQRRDGSIVGGKEKEKDGGAISALEEEVETVQAQQPLSVKDLEGCAVEAGHHGHDGNGLPFSKARCIALVVTVTGAAFLNVRFLWRFFFLG